MIALLSILVMYSVLFVATEANIPLESHEMQLNVFTDPLWIETQRENQIRERQLQIRAWREHRIMLGVGLVMIVMGLSFLAWIGCHILRQSKTTI